MWWSLLCHENRTQWIMSNSTKDSFSLLTSFHLNIFLRGLKSVKDCSFSTINKQEIVDMFCLVPHPINHLVTLFGFLVEQKISPWVPCNALVMSIFHSHASSKYPIDDNEIWEECIFLVYLFKINYLDFTLKHQFNKTSDWLRK